MSREQIVTGAADMIRRRGLNATSIREVAKHAGTPLGSTYHYFPGGKNQLATEAVQWAADTVQKVLAAKLPHAERVTLASAHHIVNIEAEEAFNAALLAFLERIRGGAREAARVASPAGG